MTMQQESVCVCKDKLNLRQWVTAASAKGGDHVGLDLTP